MTYAESQSITPDRGLTRTAEAPASDVGNGGKLRLYLGAVAVLALVASAALDSRSASQTPGLQAHPAANKPGAEAGPAFDGRGKWGGYAR